MFAPVQQDIFPVDFPRDMDRYSTSLTYRNNEVPFERTFVGRGLNDGYTAQPSGGYQNYVRPLPKNIDQLVVNPKEEYKGRVISGKHMIGKRTAEAKSFKYAPDGTVLNMNGERTFRAKSAVNASKCRSQIIMRDTNMKNQTILFGGASTGTNSRMKNRSKVKLNNDTTLTGIITNLFRGNGSTNKNTSKVEVNTDRGTKANGSNGNLQGNNKAPVITITPNDIAPLNANSYRKSNVTDGFVGMNNGGQGKVYDPTQLTQTTGRQLIENNDYNGNLSTNVNAGKVYDPNQLTQTTGQIGRAHV